MPMSTLYDTKPWRDYRSHVLADDAECAFAHLAGNCRGVLQLHHVDPLAEGGPAFPDDGGLVVLCAAHHAWLHAWRRRKEKQWKRCPHSHRSRESREQCERRLNAAA
jgi:hypothetical protein